MWYDEKRILLVYHTFFITTSFKIVQIFALKWWYSFSLIFDKWELSRSEITLFQNLTKYVPDKWDQFFSSFCLLTVLFKWSIFHVSLKSCIKRLFQARNCGLCCGQSNPIVCSNKWRKKILSFKTLSLKLRYFDPNICVM